ncbi:hypothetical protein LLEC1_06311 [Akanthomyces lecanii]|uniref:DASH complex subunit DAD1 n=1 Tax=Cordyceps confragosa TaxID=2714763 RepID=A0A179IGC5_CORDF|nr:hypothetical protein LLEC1_06311 [Akanthomyces lecanii]
MALRGCMGPRYMAGSSGPSTRRRDQVKRASESNACNTAAAAFHTSARKTNKSFAAQRIERYIATQNKTVMASGHRGASVGPSRDKSYFEQQREALLGDIAMSFEQVLGNINKLNRSLESIIAVGNEFSSVETLWSQFENVMGKDETAERQGEGDEQEEEEEAGQSSSPPRQQSQQPQQGSGSRSRGVKREAQSDVEEE